MWASLRGLHGPLSLGDTRARRYLPDVNLFAASRDQSIDAHEALARLVAPGERIVLAEAAGSVLPAGFRETQLRAAVQMVAQRPIPAPADGYVLLGDDDAAEMLALARLTEPGPFLARTHLMGRFIGVRIEGRLAAMAGERFRLAGYTEVSGVCTHPDFRGRGLARRLSAVVAAHIQARGEQPFLHAWHTNQGAIRLYRGLGFGWRADMQVAVMVR